MKLNQLQEALSENMNDLISSQPSSAAVKEEILNCLNLLRGMELPKQKSKVVDLTDAGPGMGITNHEVKFRTIEEIRMCDYDYYVRHHLALGDSSHNEVERIMLVSIPL